MPKTSLQSATTHLFNVDVITNKKTGRKALLVDVEELHTTFTEEYTANQTAETIIAPASGKYLSIRSVESSVDTNSGIVSLDFVTSGKKVFRHYPSQGGHAESADVHIEGAVDEVLKLTTTTGANEVFLIVNYIEE